MEENTIKLPKVLFFVLTVFLVLSVAIVKAQISGIESEILPSGGTGDTDILIRFMTTDPSMGNVTGADIFWDGFTVAINQTAVVGADGSYNFALSVPSAPPLSDVGNHTIRVDSFVSNYGPVSFNFTFRITEFVPSPEYIALNNTYYSLLANYSNLLGRYDQLLANYTELSTNFTDLQGEHNLLLLNYNSLSANFNSFVANFNSLSANYNSLLTDFNSQQAVYNSLLSNVTSLRQTFDSLKQDFD